MIEAAVVAGVCAGEVFERRIEACATRVETSMEPAEVAEEFFAEDFAVSELVVEVGEAVAGVLAVEACALERRIEAWARVPGKLVWPEVVGDGFFFEVCGRFVEAVFADAGCFAVEACAVA